MSPGADQLLIVRDDLGALVCQIERHLDQVVDSMEIQDQIGKHIASVHKSSATPLRDRYTVMFVPEHVLEVKGNVYAQDYRIGKVARVSRQGSEARDSYFVAIAPGQSAAELLAAAICIDWMVRGQVS